MALKSERLRKLESELKDLENWMALGLVPKKDSEKHKLEINLIKDKIKEEKERLQFLKENGESEEYIAPKRTAKQVYTEAQSLPDIDIAIDHDESYSADSDSSDSDEEPSDFGPEDISTYEESEEENPFSDKNRWKRGILEDPDSDNW